MNAVVVPGILAPVVLNPSDPSNVLGTLPGGVTVDVLDVTVAGADQWGKLALYASSTQMLQNGSTQQLYGYVAAKYFVGALQPVAPGAMKLGLSVIFNEDSAFQAARLGCRFFSVINNVDMATRLKNAYPDAVIMVRPGLDIRGALPSVDYTLQHLGGATDPRLIYLGINEGDQIGQSAANIPTRAQFDREMATRIKAISGATYAAGSFSMGAPDITNAAVVTAIQQNYAPYFNSGLFWLDQHLYSPDMTHIYREDTQTINWNGEVQTIVEHEWFETRWRFYYRRCGFDPNCSSRIVCSETGVDQGSVGGFVAHNATDQDVVNWCNRFKQLSALPIQVGSTLYPSTFLGGAIFQVGDPVMWAGYDMTRYEGALSSRIWLSSHVYVPVVTK
jgi:hypothetical protein